MEDVETPPAKEYGAKKGSSLYHPPTNEEMQSSSGCGSHATRLLRS